MVGVIGPVLGAGGFKGVLVASGAGMRGRVLAIIALLILVAG